MKDFKEVSAKRVVQRELFDGITNGSILGLAGPEHEEYVKLLAPHFNRIHLVDTNLPYNYEKHFTRFGDNGLVKGLLNRGNIIHQPLRANVDCDFCDTIVNSGFILRIMFNRMDSCEQLKHIKKRLFFTFSTRLSGGKDYTLYWLATEMYKCSPHFNTRSRVLKTPGTWPYAYEIKILSDCKFDYKLFRYRDSSHMLSGMISWT